MSLEVRRRPRHIASQGIAETTMSGRRLAGMIVAGAFAMAVTLRTAPPAKADRKDDLAGALIGLWSSASS